MRSKNNRAGEKYTTNEGYDIEIIEYLGSTNCTIKFLTLHGNILYNIEYKNIKNGCIKNPYHLSVVGVGFLGEGKYNATEHLIYNNLWRSMLDRCYGKHTKEAYKSVVVGKNWHNFQNFAEWCENNYNPETMQGWQLDKDILSKDRKIYSSSTCCFVPSEINNIYKNIFLKKDGCEVGVILNKFGRYRASLTIEGRANRIGTYDNKEDANKALNVFKSEYISEIANKWKEQIPNIVYEVLINYKFYEK